MQKEDLWRLEGEKVRSNKTSLLTRDGSLLSAGAALRETFKVRESLKM